MSIFKELDCGHMALATWTKPCAACAHLARQEMILGAMTNARDLLSNPDRFLRNDPGEAIAACEKLNKAIEALKQE